MNAHDTERISGLLLGAGYVQALEGSDPDLVVFNTCAVRENADNKLYGNLSFLAPRKKSDPNFQIAVVDVWLRKIKIQLSNGRHMLMWYSERTILARFQLS